MNENEFDLAARAWLDDGPTRMSDRAVLSALDEIHTTRQRRPWWPARRATPVSIFARMASAAVLVVAVGLLTMTVLPRLPDGSSGGGPSPAATQAVDVSALMATFVSPINGYSFEYIDRGGLTPAKEPWDPVNQPPIPFDELKSPGAPYLDQFDVVETGFGATFKGASTAIPDGVSIDAWVDASVAKVSPDCYVPRSLQTAITIDGQPGGISECPQKIEATVVAGGRLYLFTMWHNRSDARAFFDTFAATIDLTPETAVETAVDVPALTTTFVSPTNGFSFKYIDRGGLEPATELWDPVNQPGLYDSGALDIDPFDYVDTGLGAAFMGASTVIPDGASIDAWVDASVVKYRSSDCSVSVRRSQQAEISIDGQAGRISEDCPGKVVATVVVDERLYLFMILHNDDVDGRAFFDAFAATIDLRPEDAAESGGVDGLGASSPSVAP